MWAHCMAGIGWADGQGNGKTGCVSGIAHNKSFNDSKCTHGVRRGVDRGETSLQEGGLDVRLVQVTCRPGAGRASQLAAPGCQATACMQCAPGLGSSLQRANPAARMVASDEQPQPPPNPRPMTAQQQVQDCASQPIVTCLPAADASQHTVSQNASPPAATEQCPGQQPTRMGQPGLSRNVWISHVAKVKSDRHKKYRRGVPSRQISGRPPAASMVGAAVGRPQQQNTCCGLSGTL